MSSTEENTSRSTSRVATTAPSSPPSDDEQVQDQRLVSEEERARIANQKAAANKKKRPRKAMSEQERLAKVKDLEELLNQSEQFRVALTKRSSVLGGGGKKKLGEHDLEMAKQPRCIVGGKMRDYQLEGLTWMREVCEQCLSGILADEMGLGKTVQTISLIAQLREEESYYGPHLIVAPLSTLSNWMAEFKRWCPTIPVVQYHGSPEERKLIYSKKIMPHLKSGAPTAKFPVVCTSYEMVIRDRLNMTKINWEVIVVDEGHRLKNFESRLFKVFEQFTSVTRFLITGTPLQNNLKELWSLLHFLLPTIFSDWEAFDSWFNFSGIEDDQVAHELISDAKQQELLQKMHFILQPLILRRLKTHVATGLPKKREYILYAPMTKEQTDLYKVLTDSNVDTRSYLEAKVVERLTGTTNTPTSTAKSTPMASRCNSVRPMKTEKTGPTTTPKSAFDVMMTTKPQRGRSRRSNSSAKPVVKRKRKADEELAVETKRLKVEEAITPASTGRRGRLWKKPLYKEAESDDELSDDQFEAKLAEEANRRASKGIDMWSSAEEFERAKTLELAKQEMASKKLGNPMMQLRLVCNSPHLFFSPAVTEDGTLVDDSIMTSSGKMLLLDRLLRELLDRGHKVLIFSQFKVQLDLLEEYCTQLRNWEVCRIDGGSAQDDRRAQIEAFNTDPEKRIFLLSTRAGGQGINLASADTVVIFDSDWNPQQDLQAQDRAHRIGQTRPVLVYRLITRGTIEERLLMSADAKRRLEKLVIRKGAFRRLGQKTAGFEASGAGEDEAEALRSLLLKDGQVYEPGGDAELLSDGDLDVLLDRSDDAYARAAAGESNASNFMVVETKADGLKTAGVTSSK